MPGPRSRLFGPLVSATDLAAHQRLFAGAFAMTSHPATTLTSDHATALFGPAAGATELAALHTPLVPAGVVVCRFADPSPQTVREGATPVCRDAHKVVDFYAADLGAAVARARAAGFEVIAPDGDYDMAGVELREAHVHGPDRLQAAILGGAPDVMGSYVSLTERVVSEVLALTTPVSDVEAAAAFYADVFGWGTVHEYAIDGASVAALVGVDGEVRMTGRCVGTHPYEPYVGLVDYGVPDDVGTSLAGRATAPYTGLLGAVVVTDDLDAVRSRAGERAGAPVSLALAPFGSTRAVTVRTPYEVPHLVVEAHDVAW